MDWEQLRERTLGEVGTALATEGVGVAGGLLGASFIGRQIENVILGKSSTGTQVRITAGDTFTTKFKGWAANNVPKLLGWYMLRNYAKVEPGEMVTPGKEITVDAKKAFAGSVVFDTLIRVTNHGVPIGPVSFMGVEWLGDEDKQQTPALQADMQRLIQENSALRSELNKALQRIASTPAPIAVQYPTVQTQVPTPPPAAPVVRYQPVQAAPAPQVTYSEQRPAVPVRRAEEEASQMPYTYAQPTPPVVHERQRQYGFMQYDVTPPAVQERQKKYSFMSDSGEKDIAAMFGML